VATPTPEDATFRARPKRWPTREGTAWGARQRVALSAIGILPLSVPGPFRRNRLTWLAYGLQACYAYVLNGLGPAMPSLRRELGLSYTLTSLHFSAFAVGMIAAGLVGERVVGKLGRARAARLALGGMTVGVAVLLLGSNAALTLLGVLVMSTLGSLLLVVITASLADAHPGQRARALSEANVAASLASVIAPLLIGRLEAASLGWRAGIGVVLLALVPLSLAPLPLPRAPAVPSSASQGRLPAAYWAYWAALVLVIAVEFCFIYWAADFLEVDAGLGRADAAASVSVFLLAMVVGRIVGSRLADRFASQHLLVSALGVVTLGFVVYWAPLAAVARLGGLFVAGLGVALLYPLTLSLAVDAAPERAETAAARSSLASGAAIVTAPLLLGGLADHVGIRAAYTIVVLLIVGAGVAVRVATLRTQVAAPSTSVA